MNQNDRAAEAKSRDEMRDGSGGPGAPGASDEHQVTRGGQPTGEQQAAANRAVDPPA